MEDLQSTTRYVTWSLHTKSRSSLKSMLSKVTTPAGKAGGGGGGAGKGGEGSASSSGAAGAGGATAEFLENTLWNRTLGAMSEEIVAALVCQIFEGELRGAQGGKMSPGMGYSAAAWGEGQDCGPVEQTDSA